MQTTVLPDTVRLSTGGNQTPSYDTTGTIGFGGGLVLVTMKDEIGRGRDGTRLRRTQFHMSDPILGAVAHSDVCSPAPAIHADDRNC